MSDNKQNDRKKIETIERVTVEITEHTRTP